MSRRTLHIIIHAVGSIFFLLIPIVTSPDFYRASELISIPPFLRDFFSYVLLLLFFYLTYFILIPKFYFPKKVVLFSLGIIMCYLALAFLPWLLIPEHHDFHPMHNLPPGFERFPMPPHNNFLNMRITGHLAQFFMVLVLALMIRINIRFKQTEKEKLSAELSYLKAQINPHFLFNTLNSIYSLALTKSDDTAKAVVKLSAMMRYVTTEAHRDFVSLDKEIAYISSYIELQKIRLGETVDINFSVEGISAGKEIAPLLLIPFVENAFKHGVNPEEKSSIQIRIFISENSLELQVKNTKVSSTSEKEANSGLGIENTKQRLEHLYPAKHILTIKESENDFSVLLNLVFA